MEKLEKVTDQLFYELRNFSTVNVFVYMAHIKKRNKIIYLFSKSKQSKEKKINYGISLVNDTGNIY